VLIFFSIFTIKEYFLFIDKTNEEFLRGGFKNQFLNCVLILVYKKSYKVKNKDFTMFFFSDEKDGLSVCEKSKAEGPCEGDLIRWFYNKESGDCDQFSFSGCMGNNNR
jgi:hypothetical protein